MSWHYLPDLEAEFSGENSLDGEPYAPLKSTSSVGRFCLDAKWMDAYRNSLSGKTSEPLTENRGEDMLTSLPEASHAKTSHVPEKAQVLTENGADFGEICSEWFAKFDHDSSLWKTRQCSLLAGLDVFSETWPQSGMMQNGRCWELTMPERRIKENGSGFWPTPNVPNGGRVIPNRAIIKGKLTPTAYLNGKKMQVGLEQAVKWFTTPTARDAGSLKHCMRGKGSLAKGNQIIEPLAVQVYHWATPTGKDWKSTSHAKTAINSRPLSEQVGGLSTPQTSQGQLNPNWVEWLMGWPIGWTALEPLAMDKFRQWLSSHGKH